MSTPKQTQVCTPIILLISRDSCRTAIGFSLSFGHADRILDVKVLLTRHVNPPCDATTAARPSLRIRPQHAMSALGAPPIASRAAPVPSHCPPARGLSHAPPHSSKTRPRAEARRARTRNSQPAVLGAQPRTKLEEAAHWRYPFSAEPYSITTAAKATRAMPVNGDKQQSRPSLGSSVGRARGI